MAKSFKDYIGDFNSWRDKLLFAAGELAQIPQKATNLMPAIDRFTASDNAVLAKTGLALKARATLVRDTARTEYDATQRLMSEMLAFKDSVEKHPAYRQMMTQSPTEMVVALIGKFIKKSEDSKFFSDAVVKAVGFTSKAATSLARLTALNKEIKAVEALVQKTNDYAQGKGLLPVVDVPAGSKAPVSKVVYVAAAGVAALGIAYLLRRKK